MNECKYADGVVGRLLGAPETQQYVEMESSCPARGVTIRIEPLGGPGGLSANNWHALIRRGHDEGVGIRITGRFHDVVSRASQIASAMEAYVINEVIG